MELFVTVQLEQDNFEPIFLNCGPQKSVKNCSVEPYLEPYPYSHKTARLSSLISLCHLGRRSLVFNIMIAVAG